MVAHTRRGFLRESLILAGVALAAGCGLSPLPWQARTRVARIGYAVLDRPDAPTYVRNSEALRQGLRELGWVEGVNLAVEDRWADGRVDRLPDLVTELVRLPVDLLIAGGGTRGALAAKHVTTTTPIVMIAVSDPVEAGLVASFNRPGGNVTGLTVTSPETTGKMLDLLKEAAPGLSRVDFLGNPTSPTFQAIWAEVEVAARALRVTVRLRAARGPEDLDGAFGVMAGEDPDGLMVQSDAVFLPHARRIVELAAGRRLPAIYPFREFVDAGGLMSYGVSVPDLFRRAAAYADKILKGSNPAELPVEQPTLFDFVVNLKTAQAVGLTLPHSLMQQVTQVIQ